MMKQRAVATGLAIAAALAMTACGAEEAGTGSGGGIRQCGCAGSKDLGRSTGGRPAADRG